MVSIIICSKFVQISDHLCENIKSTIGVPYEIITINNSAGKLNINQAYNEGGAKANFPYLCFIHEDVLFNSANWGHIIIEMFQNNSKLGLIGLAGCLYKSDFITGWTAGGSNWEVMNLSHKDSNGNVYKSYINPENKNYSKVLVIDGVFIAVPNSIFKTVKFDSDLSGFHFYDVEYSLRIREAGFEAAVCLKKIEMLHNSHGHFNDTWFDAAFRYHKSNFGRIKQLAANDSAEFKKDYNLSKTYWLQRLGIEKLNVRNKYRLLTNYGIVIDPKYWYAALRFIVK